MLSGDNGILQQTTNARTRTIHANVLEQMQLEASAYTVDKSTGKYSDSLINYLKSKSIISDISGEEDKWLINVTTLLGSNQSMGKGTYPNDVYVLEKQSTSTGSIVNTKVATTMPIKIAATKTNQETYIVTYYKYSAIEKLELGNIVVSGNMQGKKENETVKNLYKDVEWIMAWTYLRETETWTKIEDGEQELNGDVIVKLYDIENKITYKNYNESMLSESFDCALVIEGEGNMSESLSSNTWRGNSNLYTHISEGYICDGITSISKKTFRGCNKLSKVEIGNTVKHIGANCFENCRKLENITIPNNVTSIDELAFNKNDMRSIEINIDKEKDYIAGAPWADAEETMSEDEEVRYIIKWKNETKYYKQKTHNDVF